MRVSLSLRGDYAVRAMLALAEHELWPSADGATARLTSAAIAARMRIPPRFVAHVLADLVRAGLVVGSTGRRGGYRLTRPAEAIALLAVVDAAERDDEPRRCVLRGIPCEVGGRCAAHEAFSGATEAMRAELARTSLASLVHRPSGAPEVLSGS
jgi:Rrf2 family iron-sulfur cluster assembly transcriptional regulator